MLQEKIEITREQLENAWHSFWNDMRCDTKIEFSYWHDRVLAEKLGFKE